MQQWHGLSFAINEPKSGLLLVFPVPNETGVIAKSVLQWTVLPGTEIWSDEGGAFNDLEKIKHPETDQPMNWTHKTCCHSGQVGRAGL